MTTNAKIERKIKERVDRGEKIGGGFFVFRRGKRTNRISARTLPFEHPNLVAATTEAIRLSVLNPAERYQVFEGLKSFGPIDTQVDHSADF